MIRLHLHCAWYSTKREDTATWKEVGTEENGGKKKKDGHKCTLFLLQCRTMADGAPTLILRYTSFVAHLASHPKERR